MDPDVTRLADAAEDRRCVDDGVAGHHRDRVVAARVRVAVGGIAGGLVVAAEGLRTPRVVDRDVEVHDAGRRAAVLLPDGAFDGPVAVEEEVLGDRLGRAQPGFRHVVRIGEPETADEVVDVERERGAVGGQLQGVGAGQRIAGGDARVVMAIAVVVALHPNRDHGMRALVCAHHPARNGVPGVNDGRRIRCVGRGCDGDVARVGAR